MNKESGGWGDGEIKKDLVMVEDGTFFYTSPSTGVLKIVWG
ncbi:hypothetical protein [Okeania sp. SIO2B3]|nr:hypothetical protein [Okeania sp. SIO2B3]